MCLTLDRVEAGLTKGDTMRTRLLQTLIMGTCFTALSTPAIAQTAPAGTDAKGNQPMPSDIVVTATKRSERLQDVPASVSAISGDALTQLGAARLQDYISRVPGLILDDTSFSNGLNQLTIRGLNTGPGANPTVGIYIDDSPYGSSSNNSFGGSSVPDLDPLDLERVEVVRGPQGTLYGAGSLGGLFKYVTAAPDPTKTFGRVEANGTFIDRGGSGYSLRGAANVPLTDDLAVRASGFYRRDPGFIDNVRTATHDVNTTDVYGGRVSLGWNVAPGWAVRASAMIQRLQADGNAVADYDNVTRQPLFGRYAQAREPFTGKTSQLDNFYSLSIKGDLGFATLTSATSYQKQKLDFNLDVTDAYAAAFGLGGSGVEIVTHSLLHKWTQEVRLASPDTGPLSWQIGGFYTPESNVTLQPIYAFNLSTGAILPPPNVLDAEVDFGMKEIAGFANVTYTFSPAFDITGGLRSSHNSQTLHEVLGGLLTGPVLQNGTSSDSSWTWLVTPRFHLNHDTMLYARVATGYRPGGPNLVVPGVPASYEPDRVTNYEFGFKTRINRTLSLDLAAYWIDWDNIQLNQTNSTGQNYNGNASRARSRGVEASLDWRAAPGLNLHGNVTYDDAVLRAPLPPGDVSAPVGARLPSVPEWSGQIGADYEFAVGGHWKAMVGADWRYIGDRLGYFVSPGSTRWSLPSYDVLDVRAGLRSGQLSITAYVKNVTNSYGQVAAYQLGPSTRVTVIRPRTFGISVASSF